MPAQLKCQFCGSTTKVLKRDDFPPIRHADHHELICEKCLVNTAICGTCGKLENVDKLIFSEEDCTLFCHDCCKERVVCACCGEFTMKPFETKDGEKVCGKCIKQKYYLCGICNKYEKVENPPTSALDLVAYEVSVPKFKSCIAYGTLVCGGCFTDLTAGKVRQEVRECSFCGKTTADFTDLESGQCACAHCRGRVQKCTECNEFSVQIHEILPGTKVCTTCLQEKYVNCTSCQKWERREYCEMYEPGGRLISALCRSCVAKGVYFCVGCGRAHSKSTIRSIINPSFCKRCESSTTNICSWCGQRKPFTFARDGFDHGEMYCEDCVSNKEVAVVSSYSYKPAGLFYGGDAANPGKTLFIGFENEIELNGNPSTKSSTAYRHHACGLVQKHINAEAEHVYVKRDGSLSFGFEIVSHPMTEDYFHTVDWSKMFPKEAPFVNGANTAGNHIHMSKAAFSNAQIYKLLHFFNNNSAFINLIAERTPNGYCQSVKKETFVEKAKKKKGHERDQVNMIPPHTIELRCFRGASNEKTFRKNVEFAFAIHAFTRKARLTELTAEDFCKFVSTEKGRFANLYAFLVVNQKVSPK